jgi:lycopene cyclase domain-containing protein
LNQKFLYIALNLFSIVFPFIFSFYPKASFSKKWKYLWAALLVPGVIFIIWDEFFTQLGIWGFNKKYLTVAFIGRLPLEEVLFFICIPYACVFTYEALNYLVKEDYFKSKQKIISIILIAGCLTVGVLNLDKWYTSVTFISLAAYLAALQFIWKVDYIGRFYFSYLFVLIPFFLVNGVLTGSWIEDPVVLYNDDENLGIRMGTIPVEDTFYWMLLIVMNVSIFEWLQRNR